MTKLRKTQLPLLWALFSLASLFPIGAAAQDDEADEIYTLPNFEVEASSDIGYQATNSVTATKFDIPLSELPVNMNIFTQEILEDMKFPNMREALAYNASSAGPVNFRLRGFSSIRRVKDGFRIANFPVGPTLINRMEILKGPSGVIYGGQGSPGGMIAYYRKKPQHDNPFLKLNFGVGERNGESRWRTGMDLNDSVGPVDYRIVATYATQESEGAHSALAHGGSDWKNGMAVLGFNVTDDTRVQIGYEAFDEHIKSQDGRHSARGRTIGNVPLPILYDVDPFLDLGWGRRWNSSTQDYFALIDHRVNDDLSIRVGYNMHRNQNGDDPLVNTSARELNVVQTDAEGDPVLDDEGNPVFTGETKPAVQQTFIKNLLNFEMPDFHVYARYEFEVGDTVNQLVAGFQTNKIRDISNFGGVAIRADGELNSPFIEAPDGKTVYDPGNVSNRQSRYVFFLEEEVPRELPPLNMSFSGTSGRDWGEESFDTVMTNWLGKFMNQKLNLMAGASYAAWQEETEDGVSQEEFLPQVGALYKLTDQVAPFAVFSKAMDVSGRTNSFGEGFDPIVAEGIEGGLKLNLFRNQLQGTLTAYETKNQDIIVFDPEAPSREYQQSGDPSDLGDWVQVGEITTSGIEAELLWSALENNWQTKISFATFSGETTEDPDPAKVGETVAGEVPLAFTLWSKYTIPEGPMEGFYFGGGFIWRDGEFDPSDMVDQRTKDFHRIDAFAGYKMRLGEDREMKFHLKIQDLTEAETSGQGRKPNGERYYFSNPRSIWLDVELAF